jgi:excisionase family DNA binding protein
MKLLTVKETAEILEVHRSKVYSLLRSGDLPGYRMGERGHIIIKSDELEEYRRNGFIPYTVRSYERR